jgi:protein-disulfide isomerase
MNRKVAGTSRREALRLQQEQAQQKKARTRRMLIVAAVVVLVALIIAIIAIIRTNQNQETTDADQRPVPHAKGDDSGVQFSDNLKDDAITLDIYYDYQCPWCAKVELAIRDIVAELEDSGEIIVNYNWLTFLEPQLNTSSAATAETQNSSTRAAVAATCADIVGRFEDFHYTIFENQPAIEGVGFTDDQLTKDFPQQIGLTGSDYDKWLTCYTDRETLDLVQTAADTNYPGRVTSTPTLMANGKTVTLTDEAVANKDTFLDLLKATANG